MVVCDVRLVVLGLGIGIEIGKEMRATFSGTYRAKWMCKLHVVHEVGSNVYRGKVEEQDTIERLITAEDELSSSCKMKTREQICSSPFDIISILIWFLVFGGKLARMYVTPNPKFWALTCMYSMLKALTEL